MFPWHFFFFFLSKNLKSRLGIKDIEFFQAKENLGFYQRHKRLLARGWGIRQDVLKQLSTQMDETKIKSA